MNFNERAVPHVTSNMLMKEAVARYVFAKKYIQSNSFVLDMACGTGYGAYELGKKAWVVGIDTSREALEFASKHYASSKVGFVKMDVVKTVFKNSTFDVVVAFEMIEHLNEPAVYLNEVDRVLKKNGVAVFSTPNRFIQSPDGKPMSPYHTKEYSPNEFLDLVNRYFSEVVLFGQTKSDEAKRAKIDFMKSQKIRQMFVDVDRFGLRKLIKKDTKERYWRSVGAFFGRGTQERLGIDDFLFSKKNIYQCEYIIAVCKK